MKGVKRDVYLALALAYIALGFQPVAKASELEILGTLTIPAAGVSSSVTPVELSGTKLLAPEQIIGSYSQYENKTFLFAHSSTAFSNLHHASIGDDLYYRGKAYTIISVEDKEKAAISMTDILEDAPVDTLVLMTCSGEPIGDSGDYTRRLIVTAQ